MTTRNIPSEEDFDRARAAARERNRGLSDIREKVLKRFGPEGLHEVFVLYSSDHKLFGASLFFIDEKSLEKAIKKYTISEIRHLITGEIEILEHGDRDSIDLRIDLDTDENVQKNYGGDYFWRIY